MTELKLIFPEGWVHMRKSNTEPIIRVYAEADSQDKADELTQRFSAEATRYFKAALGAK